MSSPPRYTSNAGRAFSDWSGVRRETEERFGGESWRRREVEWRKRERRGYDNSVAHKGQSSLAVGK